MAEKKNRFPGWVGPSYTSRASRFDCQRLVNYYIEMDELGSGKGQEPAVLIGTPGLRLAADLGSSPIRATYTQSNDQIAYVVMGDQVFIISGDVSTPITVSGTLLTTSGPVSISDNGSQVILVDGTYGYYIDIGTPVLNQITSPNFFPTQTITYQDGYFIGVQRGTQAFFISDINAVTFPPLNEAYAQGLPDILVAAISVNRQLYLLGAKSLEIWWDAGASASTPFERQDGRFSQFGCAAPASVTVLAETFFWLGSNAQGGGVVYMLDNAMPARISTHAVEYALQSLGDLSGAVAWSYQQEGHFFYCLNVPGSDTTWVYDMSCKQWSERQSMKGGVTSRHLAQTHCFLNGNHIVGDYSTGKLYFLDLDYYTDNGNPIPRIRQSPHFSESLNRIFYKLMEVDFQFGVGQPQITPDIDGLPPAGVDPRVVLEISTDGGQTWNNAIYASLGRIGRWNTRARWQRLGTARDAVFRVTCTEPVKTQMLSAYLDFDVGYA